MPPRGLPSSVRRSLLEKSAANQVAVVVPKKGRPSRVYTLESYQRLQNSANTDKPWQHRSPPPKAPDPLNAKAGRVKSALSRRDLYSGAEVTAPPAQKAKRRNPRSSGRTT